MSVNRSTDFEQSPGPRNERDDLVIQTLALSELELQERVGSLEADVCAYRELAQAALAAVHDLTLERDALRSQRDRLIEECRRLREHLMRLEDAA